MILFSFVLYGQVTTVWIFLLHTTLFYHFLNTLVTLLYVVDLVGWCFVNLEDRCDWTGCLSKVEYWATEQKNMLFKLILSIQLSSNFLFSKHSSINSCSESKAENGRRKFSNTILKINWQVCNSISLNYTSIANWQQHKICVVLFFSVLMS